MALIPKKHTKTPAATGQAGASLPSQTLANRILLSGRVTEKSYIQNTLGQYVFSVAIDATKGQVARAVTTAYGVSVEKVRISRLPGKRKGLGRNAGRRAAVKKAIVTVAKGTELQLFKGI